MNKSSIEYRRLRNTRDFLRSLPDMPETAEPRYQQRLGLTHRRGQKRLEKWTKFRKLDV